MGVAMAKVLQFHEHGGIEKLKLEEISVGKPTADEVLIHVDAFALNRSDIGFMSGIYTTETLGFPSRLGSEVSGTVVDIGPEVRNLRVGDKVGTIPFPGNNRYGVSGEMALAPEYVVTLSPPGLSAEEAASIWMQYLTAYFAFCEKLKLVADEHVFLPAASSSAGLGAIQFANMLGATTIAATRTAEKADFISAAGADYVIVSDEENVAARLLEITGGAGVRVAYDPVYGSYVGKYIAGMSVHGQIISYGVLDEDIFQLPVNMFYRQATVLHYYSMYNHVRDPAQLARGKAMVYGGLASAQLRPIIDGVFALDQYMDAYRHMLSNRQRGKIVVKVAE